MCPATNRAGASCCVLRASSWSRRPSSASLGKNSSSSNSVSQSAASSATAAAATPATRAKTPPTPVPPAEADDDESGERHEPDSFGQHERCGCECRTRQRWEGGESEKAERDRCRERHGRALAQPGRIRERAEREQRGDRHRSPSLDRAEPDRKRCEQARGQGRREEEKRIEARKHVESRTDECRRRLHVRVVEADEREVAKRSDRLRGRSQLGHVEDEVAERVRPHVRVRPVLERAQRDRERHCPRQRGVRATRPARACTSAAATARAPRHVSSPIATSESR